MKTSIKNILTRFYTMISKKNIDQINGHFHDLKALSLLPNFNDYLPWTEAAMRPSAIAAILNEIIINNRRSIIECGSGISTLYIAKIIASLNGKIYSIDHSNEWLQIVEDKLKSLDIPPNNYMLIHAPLKECTIAMDENKWYGFDHLSVFKDIKFDMLIVDGPGAALEVNRLARYPALPYFSKNMKEDFIVILDDISRDGEKLISEKWHKEFSLSIEYKNVEAGIALLRPKNTNCFNIL